MSSVTVTHFETLKDILLSQGIEAECHSLTLSSWSLPEAEEALIRKVLSQTLGNVNQAARKLPIARGTLYSKMKRYGVKREEDPGDLLH